MKHTKLKLYITPLFFLLSACSSNNLITEQITKETVENKTKPVITNKAKKVLCIYKKEKGIAEVTAINEYTYQFKFYTISFTPKAITF